MQGQVRAYFYLLLLVSGLVLAATHPASANPSFSSVWFANHRTVSHVDAATHTVSTTFPVPGEVSALAVDPDDSGIWVLTHKKLFKFSANSSLELEVDLHRHAKRLEDPERLLLNPYTHEVWVIAKKQLVRVSAAGEVRAQVAVSEKIEDAVLALDETLWVLGKKSLVHVSPDGVLLHHLALDDMGLKKAKRLAVDSVGGLLWLLGDKTAVQLRLADLTPLARELPLGGDIEDVALDPFTGALWVATDEQLVSHDRAGQKRLSVDLDRHGAEDVESIALDPIGRGIWAAGEKALLHFSAEGELLGKTARLGELEAIATAPGVIKPVITLNQPPAGLLTNNPKLPFSLTLTGLCNGLPCEPEHYVAGFTLQARLNHTEIGDRFTLSGREAIYTPQERLPEGLNVFTAAGKDRFGHVSASVTSEFQVDTIPPTFLAVSPADGAVFSSPAVQVEGTLDDAGAVVNLAEADDAGAVRVDVPPPRFGFRLTLKPGANSVHLRATDAAGNSADLVLNLIYNPVRVRVTNIPANAVVQGERLVVMGTLEAPANSGVTVNGAVAQVENGTFVTEIPLQQGENQIVVIATTPDGLTAMDAVTVMWEGSAVLGWQADAPWGIAAHTAKFLARFQGTTTSVQIDFDGDGQADLVAADLSRPIEFTYSAPGIYLPKIRVVDDAGVVHQAETSVVVQSPQAIDQMLRDVFGGMLSRLREGRTDEAVNAITGGMRDKYRETFAVLKPHLPTVVDQFGELRAKMLTENVAEYLLVRQEGGRTRGYFVYFLRGEDGVWRIEGM